MAHSRGGAAARALTLAAAGLACTLAATLPGPTQASLNEPAGPGTATAQASVTTAVTAPAVSVRPRVRTRTVTAGEKFRVEGKMPGRRGRKVVLSVKRPSNGWKRITASRLDRRRIYLFTPRAASTPGRQVFKVTAKRRGPLRAQTRKFVITVVEPTKTPTVEPTPTGAKGDPNDWTYISAGTSMRWNPCQPVTWSYDPARQPYPGAQADLSTAFSRVAERTGLTFTPAPVGQAALTVDWKTPAQEPMLGGSVVGIGGPSYSRIDPARNGGTQAAIVGGMVVLDASETLTAGHDAHSWGQVMLHEIMHATGLGHAVGREQVMYPSVSRDNPVFGAGDLTGLVAVGATSGCLDTTYSALRRGVGDVTVETVSAP